MFFTGNDNEQVEIIMTSSEKSYRKKERKRKSFTFRTFNVPVQILGMGHVSFCTEL